MKGVDLVISFDTTGSMSAVIGSVRRNIHGLVRKMKEADPDIRIGIIAHGDYCDKDSTYTIKSLDLTDDEDKLHHFIKAVGNTYGGDDDECYELVLQTTRTAFSWRSGNEKLLVLIGDSNPHPVGYTCSECPGFVNRIDWKNETGLLKEQSVKVYAVHALAGYRSSSKKFYQTIAQDTGGVYLKLDQFNEITDLIIAACYSRFEEEVFNQFVEIIRDKGKLSRSMASNLQQLSGKQYTVQTLKSIQEAGFVPVLPGRFQVLEVEEDCSIKDFVEANGVSFEKGRGFYELSKTETVQQYKEIILEDKQSGDMYTGAESRSYLGLQPQTASGGVSEKLRPAADREYVVYVQSTSVNRKLIGGTRFLYEVKELEGSEPAGKTAPHVPATPGAPQNMVRIPEGSFTMGSPASEADRSDDEVPHQVVISSFLMGKYPVTQKEYQEVMGKNPSNFKGDNLPVEKVSWYDAVKYCNALSKKEGLTPAYTGSGENVTWNRSADGYRLPTEAEWEYACRAGTAAPFNTGNNITTDQANYDGRHPYNGNVKGIYREKTTPVGSFAPNPWGLYDMHGNVWEWCWDWYGPYSSGSLTDLAGASSGSGRVIRGGSWNYGGQGVRSAFRYYSTPADRYYFLGFRVVRPSV